MTRGLPAALLTAFQAAELAPVHLFELTTDRSSPNDVLRFTDYDEDVVFPTAGDTFSSRRVLTGGSLEMGEIIVDGGEEGSVELRLADRDSYFEDHRAAGANFQGQTLTVKRIETGEVDAAAKFLGNVFIVEDYEQPDYEIVFALSSLLAILNKVEIPVGAVTRTEFPGIPPES